MLLPAVTTTVCYLKWCGMSSWPYSLLPQHPNEWDDDMSVNMLIEHICVVPIDTFSLVCLYVSGIKHMLKFVELVRQFPQHVNIYYSNSSGLFTDNEYLMPQMMPIPIEIINLSYLVVPYFRTPFLL